MTSVQFRAIHPVLPVRDIETAVQYYVERLGFHLAFRDRSAASTYVGLRRDSVELHLQWHDEADFKDVEAGTLMLRFFITDPETLFDEYRTKGVFHNQTQLRDTPWGTREFAFFDLNGHGLTFYRDL